MAGKARACPYLAPGIAGNEILKIAIEVAGRGDGSVHMLSSEHSAPHFHPLLVTLGVIHIVLSTDFIK
jgi:hypothetical protein